MLNNAILRKMENQNQNFFVKSLPWMLFATVILIGSVAYFSEHNWLFAETVKTSFSLFPLLGILAWSIMWTHFAYGALRIKFNYPKNKLYSVVSGWIVLFLILLHPGLLAFDMYRSLMMFPPKSFFLYVGDNLGWAIILAEIALLIFLSFEVFNRLKSKALIKKNWIWISISQMVAMTFIFVHSMTVGHNLKSGWFRVYWIVLYAILVPCFILLIKPDLKSKKQLNQAQTQSDNPVDDSPLNSQP